jgi:hypothetical protein
VHFLVLREEQDRGRRGREEGEKREERRGREEGKGERRGREEGGEERGRKRREKRGSGGERERGEERGVRHLFMVNIGIVSLGNMLNFIEWNVRLIISKTTFYA